MTGTLAVDDATYAAQLSFHGNHGEKSKTYTGPRDQIHLLPCAIARDVVDYLGVEVTPEQAAALSEPCLPSTELFDQAAERYDRALVRDYYRVRTTFWHNMAQAGAHPVDGRYAAAGRDGARRKVHRGRCWSWWASGPTGRPSSSPGPPSPGAGC